MSAAAFFGGGSEPAYWVSGTSYTQGKIIRSPADHQLYTRIVAGAGTTDPSSDATNWRPEGMRAIKSIQRGVISIPSTSATVTITSVNTAKSELRYLGGDGRDGNNIPMVPRLTLTNGTTITAAGLQDYLAFAAQVSWELTEYH